MGVRAWLILLWLCLAGCAWAVDVEGRNDLDLAGHAQVLVDRDCTATAQDMQRPEWASRFEQPGAGRISLGYVSGCVWVRLALAQSTPSERLLEVAFPLLDAVELYRPTPTGAYEMSVGGDTRPFSVREFAYRNFVFPFDHPGGGEQVYYLRAQSEGPVMVPLRLWQPRAFHSGSVGAEYSYGAYYGTMTIMVLYNLMLFFFVRDRFYLYYVLYIGTYVLFQFNLNGYAQQYLWGDWPAWSNRAPGVFMGLAIAAGTLFSRKFIDSERNCPRLDKLLWGFQYAALVASAISLFGSYRLGAALGNACGVAFTPVLLFAGALVWRRGHESARFFVYAWSFYLAGIGTTGLVYGGLIPNNAFTSIAMQIGSAVEVLLLSMALADRINRLRQEKEAAQRAAHRHLTQLNEELERLVGERTVQLEDNNRRLRESETRVRLLLESTAEGIYGVDRQGRCQFANPAAVATLGLADGQAVLGQPMEGLVGHSGADGRLYTAGSSPVYRTMGDRQRRTVTDECFVRPDGERVPVEYAVAPMVESGEVTGAVVAFRDISQRLAQEQALAYDHGLKGVVAELLRVPLSARTLEDCLQDALAVLLATPFLSAPGAAAVLVADASGQRLAAAQGLGPQMLASCLALRGGAVGAQAGPAGYRSVVLNLADTAGELGVLVLWVHENHDFQAVELAFLDTARLAVAGIVERKQAEHWLEQGRLAAESANRAKSEFLSNMSHEMRTPLHAILGFAELGASRAEDEGQPRLQGYFDRVQVGARRLSGLIEDLLELAELESGAHSLRIHEEDLAHLITDVAHRMTPTLRNHGQTLTLRVAADLPRLACDARQIRLVLRHLLQNASRYGGDGTEISLSAGLLEDHTALRIQVVDQGVGIPPAELESIFDRFTLSSKTRTGAGGTGLGLPICRRAVLAHGGRIWASNNEAGGATFTVELPLVSPATGRAAEDSQSAPDFAS